MYEHFIIMGSSYFVGKRIALHYVYQGGVDVNEIKEVTTTLRELDGLRTSFSTHYVCTDEKTWDCVVSYDPFFADAFVVESIQEFAYYLRKDLTVTGLDIAKYILSNVRCSHLQVEKLAYLCYADYLCKYGKKLCKDKIYAFTYGPVLESVYDKYSHTRGTLTTDVGDTIARSRLLVLPDGMEMVKSIDETLAKYAHCSAADLVTITHSDNSPWRKKDASRQYQIIDDDTILANHKFEEQYFTEQMA